MAERGFAEAGWKAGLTQNRTTSAAQQSDLTVEIGVERPKSQRKQEKVLENLLHEIETHVGRRVRGNRLGTGLAGYGLAKMIFFEEPLAIATQELYDRRTTQHGEGLVLAIALSAGMDGRERDFRDSYELLWRLTFAKKYQTGEGLGERITKSRESAYRQLVRIWRGMPTDVPGCIFTKDRAYENNRFVQYLYNGGEKLPRDDFLRLLQAKYDPLQPNQEAYIRSLTCDLD
jgi:hypothetical protein